MFQIFELKCTLSIQFVWAATADKKNRLQA